MHRLHAILLTLCLLGAASGLFASDVVVFQSDRDGNLELYRCDGSGQGVVRLTNDVAIDANAKISPSMDKIAFHSNRSGSSQLYLMDLDGSNVSQLTTVGTYGGHNPYGYNSWSPSGQQLLFNHGSELYRIDRDGSNMVLLAIAPAGRGIHNMDWSPSGDSIVFQAQGSWGYTNDLYIMAADGSGMRVLVANRPGGEGLPVFSPTGTSIAYLYDPSGHEEGSGRSLDIRIFVLNLLTGAEIDVSGGKPANTNDYLGCWATDGRICFVNFSNAPGAQQQDTYVMNADGSNRNLIVANGTAPDWQSVGLESGPEPFVPRLIASYSFTGNTDDESGNGLHGVLNGATLTADRFGNPNSAFHFDGVSQFIQVEDNELFNVESGGGVTVCLWFKTAYAGSQAPLSKYNSVGQGGYQPGFLNGHVFFDGRDPAYRSSGYPIAPIDDCWHFLVGQRDNETWSIWIDGIMESESLNVGSGGAINNAQPLIIGAANDVNGRAAYFTGAIDDIRIYNYALSAAEIAEQAGLIAFFPFSGDASDASGNSLGGTVFGAELTSDRFGNPNSAFNFNGVSDYIEVPDNDLFNVESGGGISVSLWFKTAYAGSQAPLSKYNSVGQGGYQPGFLNGHVFFDGRDPAYRSSGYNSHAPLDNCWHFLVGQRENDTWSIWVDGIMESESLNVGSGGAINNAQPLVIGAANDVNGRSAYFNGAIDDIRIYSRALSACEIRTLYKPAANVETFSDSAFTNWELYGSPFPVWVSSFEGRHGVFDNNGDPNYNSGAISTSTFDLSDGFVLQSEVYLDFSNPAGCWADCGFGIANPEYMNWGGYDSYLHFALGAAGEACWATPEERRGHAYIYAFWLTDCGWTNFGYVDGPGPVFQADEMTNGWHNLKVVVDRGTRLPYFYVDDELYYEGHAPIAESVMGTPRPLWLGQRSSGNAGKAYHNGICFTDSGYHGMVPQPDSLVIQVVGTDVHLNWSPSLSCADSIISYAVFYETDSEADFEFLALTSNTAYVHEHVVQFEYNMYYEVAAYNIPHAQLLGVIESLGPSPRKSEMDSAVQSFNLPGRVDSLIRGQASK